MHIRFSGKPPRGRAGSPLSTWKAVLFLGVQVTPQTFWVMVISLVVAHGWPAEERGTSNFLPVKLDVATQGCTGGKRGLRVTGAVSALDRGPAVVCRPCRSATGAACRLSRAESERRCRAPGQPPGGALCHGRGRCDCGVCICHVNEPGVYFGPLCECHEWVCETYDGSTCAGKGHRRTAGVRASGAHCRRGFPPLPGESRRRTLGSDCPRAGMPNAPPLCNHVLQHFPPP